MKSNFLITPQAWTRAPRTSVSAADYACSIEAHRPSSNGIFIPLVLLAAFIIAGVACL